MKKHIILFLSLISLYLQSQNQISGVVVDAINKNPLIGVNIVALHKNAGTITDLNGRFILHVSELDSIMFSYLGYQKMILKAEKEMFVKMQEETKNLEEVIVIGYGEQNKKDYTGSLAQISVSDIQKVSVPSIDMALAGRVAGVQITSNDAQPGSEMNIIVRGASSLTQSNSPLYVIDGFPMEDFNSAALNPVDIASVNILKDASATAIYGSRGANGVVIIETKKGLIGKPVVTYDGSYGFQQTTKKIDLMNPYDFVSYQIERDPTNMTNLYLTQPGVTLDDYKNMNFVDWQELLFNAAPVFMHNLSISGGSDRNRYVLSGSLVDQTGVVINSGFKKYQGRIRINQDITNKLSAGLNVNYSSDQNYGQIASSQGSGSSAYSTYLMYRTWGYRPVNIGVDDLFNDLFDGEDDLTAIMNPIVSSKNEVRQETRNILTANATLDYKLLDNLRFKIRGGINQRDVATESFNNSKTYRGYPSANNTKGVNGAYRAESRMNWVNENMITYVKRINRYHRFDITSAVTLEGSKRKLYAYEVYNIPNEELGLSGMDQGTPVGTTSLLSENTLLSFLTRINYNFRSKYLLTGSIRADGSSKFSPKNQWGYFPSGAFAWIMDKEKFMRNLKFISESKIRISYGVAGNNRLGDYDRYQNLDISDYYSFNNGIPQYALTIDNLGNTDLRWEKTSQLDIGYDLSLWNNRVNFIFDLYDKTTSDLLLNAKIPYSSGLGTSYKNIGKIQNRGLEITLNTINIQYKKFKWDSSFNISFNRNKVLALSEGQETILSTVSWTGDWNATYLYITKIGHPVSAFYGFVWDGNYQYNDFEELGENTYVLKNSVSTNGNSRELIKPGDVKYVDQNGDGVVNDQDLVIIGNPIPKHTGGFNNNFTLQNFTLNVFFQWSYGNDVYNANRIIFEGNETNRNINQFASYNNRWTDENQNNQYYRLGGSGPRGVYSSRTIEDGSFLRLKNIQLAYELPEKWIKLIGLRKIQIYLAMNNVYTWTKYSGMDPEVSVRNSTLTPGFDYSAYPQSRTTTGGIKISL